MSQIQCPHCGLDKVEVPLIGCVLLIFYLCFGIGGIIYGFATLEGGSFGGGPSSIFAGIGGIVLGVWLWRRLATRRVCRACGYSWDTHK